MRQVASPLRWSPGPQPAAPASLPTGSFHLLGRDRHPGGSSQCRQFRNKGSTSHRAVDGMGRAEGRVVGVRGQSKSLPQRGCITCEGPNPCPAGGAWWPLWAPRGGHAMGAGRVQRFGQGFPQFSGRSSAHGACPKGPAGRDALLGDPAPGPTTRLRVCGGGGQCVGAVVHGGPSIAAVSRASLSACRGTGCLTMLPRPRSLAVGVGVGWGAS